ncbi:MAG TPA: filamentous hemagglutinin N-terminal domain-containing protein [Coleofasciculaceae cyanobacterium]
MNQSHLKTWIVTSSILSVGWSAYALPIAAQVIPDTTLPVGERSQVAGNANVQIDGGARRGSNLFHSFSQFSVPTGGSAYFNNAADVQNIFTRVTGGSVSNIDGVIRANGIANLFVLNPNGILFGPNASLNLGGSFVATTANSINFADQFQYSATPSKTSPLLTLSVPVGLQMGANPGRIGVQGNGYDLSVLVPIFSPLVRGDSTAGLRVPVGQTLALIGGNIAIEGGTLTAEQGRIELGSIRDGQVNFSTPIAGLAFDYPERQRLGDVRLSQQALADASGGGVIQVQGNQVSLADGSLLLIQNQGTQAGGRIRVNAAQALAVSESSPDGRFPGGLDSETVGVGRGAEITVSTRRLLVQNGAAIVARSYSPAGTGNVTVKASDSTQVSGFSSVNPTLSSGLSTAAFNSGEAGNTTVSTGRLLALNGGGISASSYGIGNAGDVEVDATESVEVIGQSSLFAPSSVSATAANAGNGGKVSVNTSRLVIQGGANVSSSTVATGNAGSVTIHASEFVEVSGTVPSSSLASFVGSSAPILSAPLRQAFGLPDRPSGNSGNLTINTPRLSTSHGANVGVSNDGTGSAGTLRVNAHSILLDRGGSITGATASGEGGNLDLNVRDLLLLRNNSQITTSAGGSGNGGNLGIQGGAIAAVPSENSDIRANSANARGGNVSINTSGIFGIQFRPQDTSFSDITATGANSALNGTVQLNINQPDPTSGLAELPTNVIDPSRLIARGCPATQGNSFVISGRGGLPPNPEQQLDDDAGWQDRRRLAVAQHAPVPTTQILKSAPSAAPPSPILEATGWQTALTGKVMLIATPSNLALQNGSNQPIACPERQ